MKIFIRSFAIIREIIGQKKIEIIVDDGCNLRTIKDKLVEQYNALNEILPNVIFAINGKEVDTDFENLILSNGDTIQLIPPTGGG